MVQTQVCSLRRKLGSCLLPNMPTRLSHCLLLVAVLAAVSFLQRSKLDTNAHMQLTSIEIVTRENGGKSGMNLLKRLKYLHTIACHGQRSYSSGFLSTKFPNSDCGLRLQVSLILFSLFFFFSHSHRHTNRLKHIRTHIH